MKDLKPVYVKTRMIADEKMYFLFIAYKGRAQNSEVILSGEHTDYRWATAESFVELEPNYIYDLFVVMPSVIFADFSHFFAVPSVNFSDYLMQRFKESVPSFLVPYSAVNNYERVGHQKIIVKSLTRLFHFVPALRVTIIF